jgi:hypothetical protein
MFKLPFLFRKQKNKHRKPFYIASAILGTLGIAFFISNGLSQTSNQAVLDIRLSNDNYNSATKTFTDSSGNENHGVSANNATFVDGRYGAVDGAMSFNGVDDYLNLSQLDTLTLTNASVSFWRKSIDSTRWLLLRGHSNSHYLMAISTGNFYHGNVGANVKVYEDGQQVLKDARDGKWHHYVATGVDLSSWTTVTLNNYSSWQYKGALEGLTIYNYTLSGEEIKSLYESGKSIASMASKGSGLVGHWSMDEKDYVEGTENLVVLSNFLTGLSMNESTILTYSGHPVQYTKLGEHTYKIEMLEDFPSKMQIALSNNIDWYSSIPTIVSAEILEFYVAPDSTADFGLSRRSYGSTNFNSVGNHSKIFYSWSGLDVTTSPVGWRTTWSDGLVLKAGSYLIFKNFQAEKNKTVANPFVDGIRYGRLTDSTPYTNHGDTGIDQSFTFTEDRFGKEGGAMFFDGEESSYIEISSGIIQSYPFTLSTWVKLNDTYNRQVAVSLNRDTVNYHTIGVYNGKWSIEARSPQYIFSSNIDTDNDWHHIVGVFRSNIDREIYVDGISGGIDTGAITFTEPLRAFIGKQRDMPIGSGHGPLLLDGSLDDIRIYNRALSETEIKSLYDTYNPKTTTGSLQKGLVLDMPLKSRYTKSETAESEIMTDRTPYSNDGQNYGAAVTNDGTSFDGTDDYVNLGKKLNEVFKGTNPWTIQQWVNYDTGFSYYPQFNKGAPNYGPGFTIHGSSGRIQGGNGVDQSFDTSIFQESLPGKGWTHTVVSYDGEKIQSYINGQPRGSLNWVHGIGDTSTFNLYFARFWGPYGGMDISNILIYNRALSDEEVKTLYDRGRSDAGIIFNSEN